MIKYLIYQIGKGSNFQEYILFFINCVCVCLPEPVVFTLGMFQNVSIPVNGSVEVNVSRIPAEVAFVTLQFHTQHRNATMSYTRVRVSLSHTRMCVPC